MSTCPICQKESVKTYSPFCSAHCKNVDLLKWLNEKYKIPASLPAEEDPDLSSSVDEEENF